ncbi:hypothetical protein LTS18_003524 [Coniosporium uncinatum]|uniref:Uncharacterized protein n=1 Tax=Coniosporium uncinatum TaxID=93489 RepID=A0ACC3DTV6_9PEZI|nr:hypothetical protein LTS18_003524 [Coniosporium uncinatum]
MGSTYSKNQLKSAFHDSFSLSHETCKSGYAKADRLAHLLYDPARTPRKKVVKKTAGERVDGALERAAEEKLGAGHRSSRVGGIFRFMGGNGVS